MKTLVEILKEKGLLEYQGRFDDEGFKIVGEAVATALDERPAVFGFELRLAIIDLGEENGREYGSIGKHGANPYLCNSTVFLSMPLKEVVQSILEERHPEKEHDVRYTIPQGHDARGIDMQQNKVYFHDKNTMKEHIESFLIIDPVVHYIFEIKSEK